MSRGHQTLIILCLVALAQCLCPHQGPVTKTFSSFTLTDGASLEIPANQVWIYDWKTSPMLEQVTVSGSLIFSDTLDLELHAKKIIVQSGGKLIAGSCECPFEHKLLIELHGVSTDPLNSAFGTKVIGVADGGELNFNGKLYGPSWTTLAATAPAGATVITLSEAVNWQVGAQIVLATTDYFENQNEVRSIVAVSGSQVTLDSPLTNLHYSNNYRGIEMRGEVGLLTRNIVIRGDASSESTLFGGHTMYLSGSTISLRGVEVTRAGQNGVLGRYPVHFHVAGNVTQKAYIEDNAIHNCYQRCITVHNTHGITVQRNVGYNTLGHCYFLEVATETQNQFNYNLGIWAKATQGIPLPSDTQPAIFWITNPQNSFVGNHAVGGTHSIWFALPHYDLIIDTAPTDKLISPRKANILKFIGNVAHSAQGDGFHFDNPPNPDNKEIVENTNVQLVDKNGNNVVYVGQNYDPYLSDLLSNFSNNNPINGNAETQALIQDLTVWKCRNQGVWMRPQRITIDGFKSSDNKIGFTSATEPTTILKNAIFVGVSDNFGKEGAVNAFWPSDFPVRGYEFYDGPNMLSNAVFYDFVSNAKRQASAIGQLWNDRFAMSIDNRAEKIFIDPASNRLYFGAQGEDGDKQLHIRDLDGTISGRPPVNGVGTVVVINHPSLKTPSCVENAAGLNLFCPDQYGIMSFSYAASLPSGYVATGNGLTTLYRKDKISSPISFCGGGVACADKDLSIRYFSALYIRNKEYYLESDFSSISTITLYISGGTKRGDQTVFAVCLPAGATVSLTRDGGALTAEVDANAVRAKDFGGANSWSNAGSYFYSASSRMVWVKPNYADDWNPIIISVSGGSGQANGCSKPSVPEAADTRVLPPVATTIAVVPYTGPSPLPSRDSPCVTVGKMIIPQTISTNIHQTDPFDFTINVDLVSPDPVAYRFTVKAKASGMLALAFAPTQYMVGSDAVISWKNTNNQRVIDDFFLGAKRPCDGVSVGVCQDTIRGGTSDITEATATEADGYTTISFVRKQDTGDANSDVVLAAPGKTQKVHIAINDVVGSVSIHSNKVTLDVLLPGICSNGIKSDNEECDDRNGVAGDGCSETCTIEAGWVCTGDSPSVCTPKCGDNSIISNEECDDGNLNNGDGCSSTCKVEAGYRCSSSGCIKNVCGDGFTMDTETCDDGGLQNGDGCSSTCQVEAGYTCSGQPSLCVICGDGVKAGGEQCDDGNKVNGDGCSSTCTLEKGWDCKTATNPTTCNSICGDGVVVTGEGCDDGNSNANDGCNGCKLEQGWSCASYPCTPICGDGLKRGKEQCDDGNVTPRDGCASDCTVETGFTCMESNVLTSPSVCVVNTVATKNSVSIVSGGIPTAIPATGSLHVRVYYTALQESAVQVSVNDDATWNWRAGSTVIVPAGAGFVTVSVNVKGLTASKVWFSVSLVGPAGSPSYASIPNFASTALVSSTISTSIVDGIPAASNQFSWADSQVPLVIPSTGTIYMNFKYAFAEQCHIVVNIQEVGGSYNWFAGTEAVVPAGTGSKVISMYVSGLPTNNQLIQIGVYVITSKTYLVSSQPWADAFASGGTQGLKIVSSIATAGNKAANAVATGDQSYNGQNTSEQPELSQNAQIGIGVGAGVIVVVAVVVMIAFLSRKRRAHNMANIP